MGRRRATLAAGSRTGHYSPACGGFLMLCDTVARTALAPSEIPVGVMTAMLGGPFFIWLLRSGRRSLWA
ncbi:MAG: iron chelate uptake ABC transporter family permease subunit [Bryobacterales bacterium]|nr:iron chelate uptake ABC transporter family permease subunit [Bryobacterales bacterium]